MSLKSLQFDPYLLSGLYPEPLVGTRLANSTSWAVPGGKITLIVYRKREAGDLPENQQDFLRKLVTACKLTPEEVIITGSQDWGSMEALFTAHKAGRGLVFGWDPPASRDLYSPVRLHQAEVVFADDLRVLSGDSILKSRLWKVLRLLFRL